MRWLSPRFRISLAMASVVVVFISLASMFGLMPDADRATLRGRARLCESIALSSSAMVARGDAESMRALLEAVVDRDSDVLTIGVRKVDGELLTVAGPHAEIWSPPPEDRSTAEQMQVPVYHQGDQKWGNLEFRFAPLHGAGPLGLLISPRVQFITFLSIASFLAFALILRVVLKHLDPSKAVPRRVREALDNLAEGLLILDTKDHILLGNSAFAAVMGVPAESSWASGAFTAVASREVASGGTYPWTDALQQQRPVSNVRMQLRDAQGRWQSFNVNCSPLLGSGGRYCGVMVTFDDVTALDQEERGIGKGETGCRGGQRRPRASSWRT